MLAALLGTDEFWCVPEGHELECNQEEGVCGNTRTVVFSVYKKISSYKGFLADLCTSTKRPVQKKYCFQSVFLLCERTFEEKRGANWQANTVRSARPTHSSREKPSASGCGGSATSSTSNVSGDHKSDDSSVRSCCWNCESSLCAALTDTDLDRLILLPDCINQPLAFFHHINVIYGVLAEYCSSETCPNRVCNVSSHNRCYLSENRFRQFFWIDDKGKKCKYAAPQYIDCVMSIVEKIVHSEECLPTRFGHDFPAQFDSHVRKISRLLFHVLAHIYAVHFDILSSLNIWSQCLALYRHFGAYCRHFSLLNDAKDAQMFNEILDEWNALAALKKSSDAYHNNKAATRNLINNANGSNNNAPTASNNNDHLLFSGSMDVGQLTLLDDKKLRNESKLTEIARENVMNKILDDDF
uniref:Mob1/phocein family protein n=1 Tax=Romanomermis culicivorax TaxID=13658 RepID=A0A915KM50_ROMCU